MRQALRPAIKATPRRAEHKDVNGRFPRQESAPRHRRKRDRDATCELRSADPGAR